MKCELCGSKLRSYHNEQLTKTCGTIDYSCHSCGMRTVYMAERIRITKSSEKVQSSLLLDLISKLSEQDKSDIRKLLTN